MKDIKLISNRCGYIQLEWHKYLFYSCIHSIHAILFNPVQKYNISGTVAGRRYYIWSISNIIKAKRHAASAGETSFREIRTCYRYAYDAAYNVYSTIRHYNFWGCIYVSCDERILHHSKTYKGKIWAPI